MNNDVNNNIENETIKVKDKQELDLSTFWIPIIVGVFITIAIIRNVQATYYSIKFSEFLISLIPTVVAIIGVFLFGGGSIFKDLFKRKNSSINNTHKKIDFSLISNDKKRNKTSFIVLGVALLVLVILIKGIDISSLFISKSEKLKYNDSLYIHDDVVYYESYDDRYDPPYNRTIRRMDINGKKDRLLVSGEEVVAYYTDFVYDGKLYYNYNNSVHKAMDLNTKKIDYLQYTGTYIVESLHDNYIYGYHSFNDHTIIHKIDLNSFNVVREKRISNYINFSNAYIDYDNLDIYYLKGKNLYKNDEFIHTIPNFNSYIVYGNDRCVYYIDNYNLYKVSKGFGEPVLVQGNYNKLGRIQSYNSEVFLRDNDGNVYSFNPITDKMDLIFNSNAYIEYVYRSRNYLVFASKNNSYHNRAVVLYNESTKETTDYFKSRYLNVEYNKIYILSDDKIITY